MRQRAGCRHRPGAWMLLTGVGASLGRTARRLPSPIVAFVAAEVFIALLPIADVFLLRWLRNVVFLRGAEVGLSETAASCFVLLAPYCLVTGYALTLACHAVEPSARAGAAAIGTIYVLDNLGNVLGGVAFLVVAGAGVRPFRHVVPGRRALNLSAGVLRRRSPPAAAPGGRGGCRASGPIGDIAACDLDQLSRRLELAGQEVIYHGLSPYGSLVVTKSGRATELHRERRTAVLHRERGKSGRDGTLRHGPASRRRNVLLVSGGVSGTLQELLKYPVRRIDYVELDPLILEVARAYSARQSRRPAHPPGRHRRPAVRAASGAGCQRASGAGCQPAHRRAV